MMLADLGADVVKIATPLRGAPRSADHDRKAISTHTNCTKRSVALDLKAPAGRDLFIRLAADADVVMEGFRPASWAGSASTTNRSPRSTPAS